MHTACSTGTRHRDMTQVQSPTPTPSLSTTPGLLSGRSSRPQSCSLGLRERSLEMKHGVLPDYTYRARSRLQTVVFQPQSQSCVLHHRQGYSLYRRRNAVDEVDSEEAEGQVLRILWAEEPEVYVGVCRNHLKVSICTYFVSSPG